MFSFSEQKTTFFPELYSILKINLSSSTMVRIFIFLQQRCILATNLQINKSMVEEIRGEIIEHSPVANKLIHGTTLDDTIGGELN